MSSFHFFPIATHFLQDTVSLLPNKQTFHRRFFSITKSLGFWVYSHLEFHSYFPSFASGVTLGLLTVSIWWTPGSSSVLWGNLSAQLLFPSQLCPVTEGGRAGKLAEWIPLRPPSWVHTHVWVEMHAFAFRDIIRTRSCVPSYFIVLSCCCPSDHYFKFMC